MYLKKFFVIILFLATASASNAWNNYSDLSSGKGEKSFVPTTKDSSHNNSVIPIERSRFKKGNPKGEIALRWKKLVNNTCNMVLNEWWPASQCKGREGEYIDFGYLECDGKTGKFGTENKGGIRPTAQHAYTIAVAVFTNSYDSTVTNVPVKTAIDRAVTIIKSLAKDHLVNGGINVPWGDHWQSAQWASKCAVSAWLLWNHLEPIDQENVRKMIEHEADRFLDIIPPVANENYINDTKGEENAWNATGIQTACAMMTHHKNFSKWLEKSIEYRISALASPSDIKNEKIVNGKKVKQWVTGYNIDSLGALGNHNAYPHPDYMASPLRHTVEGSAFLALSNLKIPKGNKFNCNMIYENIVNYKWNNTSTIYKKDGTIYWPIKKEEERRLDYITYGIIDAGGYFFGYDRKANVKAKYWESQHTSRALELNLTDYIAASAYLLHWLEYQGIKF